MAGQTKLMLVTANVGSIFEDPQVLLVTWVKEFLKSVKEVSPKFLALHCQEIGGKNYEESMVHVDSFVRTLLVSDEMSDFIHVKVFLDEDFSSTERFTALGNLYFIHRSVTDCQIWDFKKCSFEKMNGQEIFAGNIEEVPLKEKDKFPKELFPECKWSRKGFMRTRWSISGTTFDLINIHLFHDASNFTAMESFPSSYSKTRQKALRHTLDRFQNDSLEKVPFFLFGDFNFRLNTGEVVRKLTSEATETREKCLKKGTTERVIYKKSDSDSSPLLTLEKKVFDLFNQEDTFYLSNNNRWLLEHDIEVNEFKDQVFEFEIKFPPSYPFTEDNCGTTYMKTRCPAWCDRILVSHSGRDIIHCKNDDDVTYQMMGSDVPMGDHKPIVLTLNLVVNPSKSQVDLIKEHETASPDFVTTSPVISENQDHENVDPELIARMTPVIAPPPVLEPKSDLRRSRTTSNPSSMYSHSSSSHGGDMSGNLLTRRINSLVHAHNPLLVHSPEWLKKTQKLLRGEDVSDDDNESPRAGSPIKPKHTKRKLSRVSSRLTSHHSSSSEEWYSELPEVREGETFGGDSSAQETTPKSRGTSHNLTTKSSSKSNSSSNGRRSSNISSKVPKINCFKCTIS